jgi:hypothetical protein
MIKGDKILEESSRTIMQSGAEERRRLGSVSIPKKYCFKFCLFMVFIIGLRLILIHGEQTISAFASKCLPKLNLRQHVEKKRALVAGHGGPFV